MRSIKIVDVRLHSSDDSGDADISDDGKVVKSYIVTIEA